MDSTQFTDEYAALPSTASANHPHIINVATYKAAGPPEDNVKLPDAVATMLYQISSNGTDVLSQFLDANRPSFRLVQKYIVSRYTDQLIIAKKNDEVLVGTIVDLDAPYDCFEFDNLVRYRVAQDGSWSITYTSYRDYFRRNWDDVWAGRTIDMGFGSVNMTARPGNDPSGRLDLFPGQLAEYIMYNRLWDAARCKRTIT